MKYRLLGKTGFEVSPICLGTAQFGTGTPRDLALWQLDAFTDRGANFMDTARVYGDWEPGERARSEKLIGEWLKRSGKRDKVVIMTKGAHPLLETMHISRCVPGDIETDIDGSLQSLGIEQIDLYLLHRDNPALPAGALLDALEKARVEGKIKHYGFSNWKLDRIREAEAYAIRAGIEGFTCNQVMWSLAETTFENLPDKTLVPMDKDTYDWHRRSALAVTAYNSTAQGWFMKLEKGQEIPEKHRILYDNEKNRKIYARLKEAAAELELSALDLSLGYVTGHPFPSVPITSFSRKEQLEEAIRACETVLPADLIQEFNILKGIAPA
jgi:aryl-alcohol dehydrogenase-like predicted oxidoreductase